MVDLTAPKKPTQKERTEFRALAGEWVTGKTIYQPPLIGNGDNVKDWNKKVDEFGDEFVHDININVVSAEFLKRIPDSIKHEFGILPEPQPENKKKKRTPPQKRTPKQSQQGTPSRIPTTTGSNPLASALATALATAATPPSNQTPSSPKPVSQKQPKASPTHESAIAGRTDPNMGPAMPVSVAENRMAQEQGLVDPEEHVITNEPKSRFSGLKKSISKIKTGLKNVGGMAWKTAKAATVGALVNETELTRNLILTGAAAKAVWSGKGKDKETGKGETRSITDIGFDYLHGNKEEKKGKSSLEKASEEENASVVNAAGLEQQSIFLSKLRLILGRAMEREVKKSLQWKWLRMQ